jgi:hypothetical protein
MTNDDNLLNSILGIGLEPITPALITELCSKGWSISQLQELQNLGYSYNRHRNSFFAPPEFIPNPFFKHGNG